MSEIKAGLVYSEAHEWALSTGGTTVRIGITDYAQCELGDIVFVELPGVGASVNAGDSLGAIESVKTVSEVYSPVSGRIIHVNRALEDRPELVNEDPYGAGWIAEIETDGSAEEALGTLMTPDAYRAYVEHSNK